MLSKLRDAIVKPRDFFRFFLFYCLFGFIVWGILQLYLEEPFSTIVLKAYCWFYLPVTNIVLWYNFQCREPDRVRSPFEGLGPQPVGKLSKEHEDAEHAMNTIVFATGYTLLTIAINMAATFNNT